MLPICITSFYFSLFRESNLRGLSKDYFLDLRYFKSPSQYKVLAKIFNYTPNIFRKVRVCNVGNLKWVLVLNQGELNGD
jgi:hypothetical protein